MRPKRQSSGTDSKAQNRAKKAHEEAVLRAFRAFTETKEQADIAYGKALKRAIDEQAKKEANIKYRETLERARKVRHEAMDEAQKAFSGAETK